MSSHLFSIHTSTSQIHSMSSQPVQETYFIEWDAKVELLDADQSGSRTPKRVPMACTFCRKRKLKCDGRKTSCGNCERRNIPCTYVPVSDDKPE